MDSARKSLRPWAAPLPFPTANDTAITAQVIAEGAAQNFQDVTTGIVTLGSYKYSSQIVKVSWEVLQDSGVNVPEFLARTFGERFGRAIATDLLTGNGTTAPTGVLTSLTNNAVPSLTAVGSSGNDGVGAANSIGSDDLVKLMHSVDPAYRANGQFLMNDQTLSALMQVKDKYGRMLWSPGLSAGEPDRIFNKPIRLCQSMDTLQTSASSPAVTKKVVLFGDFSKYVIRIVRDMTIMRQDELYAVNGQVGFLAFWRLDANMLDAGTHPIKLLQTVY